MKKQTVSTVEVKRDILWRVYLCYIAVVLVCVLILAKAFYIQQVQGKTWRSMSDSLHEKMQDIEADRGTIYSEDGQMLSTSIPQFDVYIDFAADGLREKSGKRFRENIDSLSYCLANLFKDASADEYKKLLKEGYADKDRYFLLHKKTTFREYEEMRKFPLVRLGKNKSGFIAQVKSIRLNPYQLLAYRTIGLDRENAQKVGLEQTYDTLLKGTTGKRLVRYIAGGVAVPVDDDYQIEPENGKDIITTLDIHIQEIAENALMKAMLKNSAQYGTCIVMETKTGKIKAIANLGKHGDSAYWEDYNYAMRTTEPGSTIKLATLLSVLSEGKTSINDLVEVGAAGHAYVGVRDVPDAEKAPKTVMTVKECFAHSSNVGMSKIAFSSFASQPEKFRRYLHQLRLDTVTGIDLQGEEKPRLPKLNKTNEGLIDMVTLSFGYAIQISPLQTLTLYNAIANNGKMVKPYLVNSVQADGEVVKQFEPVVLNEQVCKPDVIKAAQECMQAVTTEGTAKEIFKNNSFPVAGKTGTAHFANGGYTSGEYLASFVGYFPADKPQFTCMVLIKTKPNAAVHFGGAVSGPVFKEIADRLYTMFVRQNSTPIYTGISKTDSAWYSYEGMGRDVKQVMSRLQLNYKDSASQSSSSFIHLSGISSSVPVAGTVTISNKQMPSLSGMGLKDAVYVCENMGLKVSIKGRGKVAAQSLLPGQTIAKGQSINIQLN